MMKSELNDDFLKTLHFDDLIEGGDVHICYECVHCAP